MAHPGCDGALFIMAAWLLRRARTRLFLTIFLVVRHSDFNRLPLNSAYSAWDTVQFSKPCCDKWGKAWADGEGPGAQTRARGELLHTTAKREEKKQFAPTTQLNFVALFLRNRLFPTRVRASN